MQILVRHKINLAKDNKRSKIIEEHMFVINHINNIFTEII